MCLETCRGRRKHTCDGVAEKLIRLNLVEGRLEQQTLLAQLIGRVVVVTKALNLLGLLAEELDVSRVFVLGLCRRVGGTVLLDPALIGIVPLIVTSTAGELEVLLECLFAICRITELVMASYEI
jgi:hypothetical protein